MKSSLLINPADKRRTRLSAEADHQARFQLASLKPGPGAPEPPQSLCGIPLTPQAGPRLVLNVYAFTHSVNTVCSVAISYGGGA